MTAIHGVILDMDGTLIDSNDAHARAWVEAMAEYGFRPPFQEVRRLIGMGGTFLIPRAIGIDADNEIGEGIRQRRREIFRTRYLPQLRPFPQVRELVARMRSAGLKQVIASASKREELEPMLRITGIADLVEGVTTASEVEDPKPEPDVVAAALDKLALAPDQVLMLGDTPYDLEAAGKIGVGVVAVCSGGWKPEELSGAVAVYRDAADLLANFESSPFARRGGDGED